MQKNYWRLKCLHTPETIDKIVMSFRKRGLMVDSFNYKKLADGFSVCELEFEEEPESAERIRNNALRLEDILEIEVLEIA